MPKLSWNPFSKGGLPAQIFNGSKDVVGNLFSGTPEKHERVSTLLPGQQPILDQAIGAAKGPGAGGAFGDSADYYRNLLSDDGADFNAFAAPQIRQYNEDIMPQISEQFAGMGSGGLSSSGFQNAQTQGGVDLAERLGSIRANLRQAGAQGLQNIGQTSLGNYSQDVMTQPGSEGLLSSLAPAIGTGIGALAGGPAGAAIGSGAGNWFKNSFGGNKVGANSSPYGSNQPSASPKIGLPQRGF